ncbi:hypothetical protein SAMN05444146_3158 [Flavobacterium johnsoniae]|nr:hypothetical protein SAMN05444146_3158 [Flavobacterium johnsoniae]
MHGNILSLIFIKWVIKTNSYNIKTHLFKWIFNVVYWVYYYHFKISLNLKEAISKYLR